MLCAGLILLAQSPTARAAAATAPTCGPATLDDSALLGGVVTVSPLPGSRDAGAATQISFEGVPARELSVQSVTGSASGHHTGRLEPYSQGDGASFLPSRPFSEGERVTVHALLNVGGHRRPLLDVFAIARQDQITTTPEANHAGRASEQQSFASRPDLHPPLVTVTASSPQAAPGDVFLAPYAGPGQTGPMILDPSGALVWFKPLPEHVSAANLRVQQYAGKPVLTWWQGDISVHGYGLGTDVIDDQSYAKIAQVKAGNGLLADLHDFQLTPRGTALITAYDPVLCNISGAGGPAYGAVTDGVLQEIDVRTGLVRMQWTSLDHVGLGESYERASSSTAYPFDYFHINSINLDPDGGLLISSRNTWTVYDLEPGSERIAWRLGGRHSSFAEPGVARTAFQHDPRELPDGSISVFDNGSSPTVHPQSRGVVLSLDPQTGTATLVSQLTHPTPLISKSQGNLQALPNGDWFVGWGQEPDFSEFDPEGQLLFDAHLPVGDQSYRALRFQWTAKPPHSPSLAYRGPSPGAPGGIAYASWNGATEVASWRLLAGGSPSTLAPVAQVTRAGFETAIAVPAGAPGPDASVQALDASGNVLGVSATAAVPGI
ncbi:MAG TPA: arylsulfotransferase family protein [Solirubrobacteraceae bacterium]|nr:arylsulfotransferase family protein [Solirubrobacteraceae bacterium]